MGKGMVIKVRNEESISEVLGRVRKRRRESNENNKNNEFK